MGEWRDVAVLRAAITAAMTGRRRRRLALPELIELIDKAPELARPTARRPEGGAVREFPRPVLTYRGEDVTEAFTATYHPPGGSCHDPAGAEGGWTFLPRRTVVVDAVNGRPMETPTSYSRRSWDDPILGPVTFQPMDRPDPDAWPRMRQLLVRNDAQRTELQGGYDGQSRLRRLGELAGTQYRDPTWSEVEAAILALRADAQEREEAGS